MGVDTEDCDATTYSTSRAAENNRFDSTSRLSANFFSGSTGGTLRHSSSLSDQLYRKHEFPVFNLKTRKTLRLRERPLIVMDGTLTHPQYMGLRPTQVLEWIQRLSNACRQYNGVLNLLWHNSSLIQSWEKELYLELFGVIT